MRLSEIGPTATAWQRVLLATPLLWALRWRERRREGPAEPGGTPWVLGLAGLAFAGDLAVWHLSIVYTTVANATLFANTAPLFVGLAAWRLFGERVGRPFVIGFALALGGAAIVLGASFAASREAALGDGLGLATAVFYAAYQLCIKLGRGRHSTLSVMAVSTTVCALALLPIALASGEELFPQTTRGWLVLVGVATVSHCGGQGLIAWSLAHLPASFSSVALLFQPVSAAFFAWWIVGETLSPQQVLGGFVVLAGIVIVKRGTGPRHATISRRTSKPS